MGCYLGSPVGVVGGRGGPGGSPLNSPAAARSAPAKGRHNPCFAYRGPSFPAGPGTGPASTLPRLPGRLLRETSLSVAVPYRAQAKLKESTNGVVVETAEGALEKIAELTDLGHTDLVVKDLLGGVVDRATLEA
jgi:hypothetical protein